MGSGKTTVGQLLATRQNLEYVDIDSAIEAQETNSIKNLLMGPGSLFRELETEYLEKLPNNSPMIISTGGGVVQKDENWDEFKRLGITIYLKASAEVLFNRLKDEHNERPLISNPKTEAHLKAMVKELLLDRSTFYNKADVVVDTENLSPDEVCDRIEEAIK